MTSRGLAWASFPKIAGSFPASPCEKISNSDWPRSPGGQQQMLAIARVMMAGAKIILMDEPTQGLAPALVCHIRDIVTELKRQGVTVLLVEQNARVALSVCDRGYIMEKGVIVFEASSRELRDSPVTREKLGV